MLRTSFNWRQIILVQILVNHVGEHRGSAIDKIAPRVQKHEWQSTKVQNVVYVKVIYVMGYVPYFSLWMASRLAWLL